MAKFPNRVLVYGVEGGFPMFFDVDGRGSEIFPTGMCTVIVVLLGIIKMWDLTDIISVICDISCSNSKKKTEK